VKKGYGLSGGVEERGKKATASAEDGEVAVEWRIGPTQYLPSTLKFVEPFLVTLRRQSLSFFGFCYDFVPHNKK